jgi:hypothetical protein
MPNNPNEMKPDGTTKIKIIKLINGTDIVCEIAHAEQNKPLLTLDKPLEVKYVPQITNIGINKLVRREENERTRKLMDREMMSPSEREEFEEIFDDFDDLKKKDKTIH